MNILTPEWLTLRGGSLQLGSDSTTWYVLLDNKPQYALVSTPAGGRFGCYIKQTINGQRVESKARVENSDAAVVAGLDELRKHLGW